MEHPRDVRMVQAGGIFCRAAETLDLPVAEEQLRAQQFERDKSSANAPRFPNNAHPTAVQDAKQLVFTHVLQTTWRTELAFAAFAGRASPTVRSVRVTRTSALVAFLVEAEFE
jgi:hypothetical protein